MSRVGSSDGELFYLDVLDDSIEDPQAAAISGKKKHSIGFGAASRVGPRFSELRKTSGVAEKLVGTFGVVCLLSIVTGVEVLEEALAGDLGGAIKSADSATKRVVEFVGKTIDMNGVNSRKAGEDISVGEESRGGGFERVGGEPKAPGEGGG